jgi:hypothetical protein
MAVMRLEGLLCGAARDGCNFKALSPVKRMGIGTKTDNIPKISDNPQYEPTISYIMINSN